MASGKMEEPTDQKTVAVVGIGFAPQKTDLKKSDEATNVYADSGELIEVSQPEEL